MNGAQNQPRIRVRHTPNCRHPYMATSKGYGGYGWGNTPDEARAGMKRQILLEDARRIQERVWDCR